MLLKSLYQGGTCIIHVCVKGIDCVSVSSFVLLDVRSVRVVWYFVFVFNLNKNVDIDFSAHAMFLV
jgi:hypothetical protein